MAGLTQPSGQSRRKFLNLNGRLRGSFVMPEKREGAFRDDG
jgi:hypothetical protein